MRGPHDFGRWIDVAGQDGTILHLEIADRTVLDEAVRRSHQDNQLVNDMIARRLLKQWVSELPPMFFMRDFRIIGIGAEGRIQPTIWA